MLSVAIDARRLQDQQRTGVGRGLADLLPHLVDHVDLVLLTDARRPPVTGSWHQIPLFGWGPLPEPFWLQVSVAAWLRRFDGVFHGSYNAVPMAYRGPSVVTIYDLSWEQHAEDLSATRQFSFAMQARWSVRAAQAVMTPSEFTRRAIIDTYHVDPDRITVTPYAADPLFSPRRADTLDPVLRHLGIAKPYVVAIGGAKRRGLEVAVEAWRRLPDAARPSLVVVGDKGPPPGPGIHHVGRIDDDTWSTLLAGAEAFCYPTRYEGFGLPAIEAAASGVPVVCARVGSLPEILGAAAEWCESPSAGEISTALARVLAEPARRRDLIRAGLATVADAPTWADTAQIVLDTYHRAYGRTRR